MNLTKKIPLLASLALISFACSNSGSKNKAAQIDNMAESIEANIQNIPAPNSGEIMSMINETKTGYVYDITNPVENIEKYITTKQKAICMGVYASDLSYNSVYMKKAESQTYLDNIMRLVGDLNIGIDQEAILKRIEANADNKDSLPVIVKELLSKSQIILNESNQNDIALYFLIGSWVESAYITGMVINFAENKKPLYSVISKHYEYLEQLLKFLDKKKNQADFGEYFTKLSAIKVLFDELKSAPEDPVKIEALKTKFTELRNNII